jgi:hypothetical protein
MLVNIDCPVCGNSMQVNTKFKKNRCTCCKRGVLIDVKWRGNKPHIDAWENEEEIKQKKFTNSER